MSKYKVKLHCWYQERGGIEQEEIIPFDSDGFDNLEETMDWFNENKEHYFNYYPITKIEFDIFNENKHYNQELLSKERGDEVKLECLSSIGSSSSGTKKVKDIQYKYNEDTGEKYKIIILDLGDKYDARTGYPIEKNSMYYIK